MKEGRYYGPLTTVNHSNSSLTLGYVDTPRSAIQILSTSHYTNEMGFSLKGKISHFESRIKPPRKSHYNDIQMSNSIQNPSKKVCYNRNCTTIGRVYLILYYSCLSKASKTARQIQRKEWKGIRS